MKKTKLLVTFILLFVVALAAQAINANLAGEWVMGTKGLTCRIYQQGNRLAFINEHGQLDYGELLPGDRLTIDSPRGVLRGDIVVTPTQTTVKWHNNTEWVKKMTAEEAVDVSGQWTYKGKTCTIYQNGAELYLINEKGDHGRGVMINNTTVIAIPWGFLNGSLEITDLHTKIYWNNGTVWTRVTNEF